MEMKKSLSFTGITEARHKSQNILKMSCERALHILLYNTKFPEIKEISVKFPEFRKFPETSILGMYVFQLEEPNGGVV